MLKEIHEQPRVIRDTLAGRLVNGALSIDELDLTPEELNLIDRVYVIACGTSYHAGLIAKNLIEGWARIPTECEVASEFRYRNPIITPDDARRGGVSIGRDGRHARRYPRRPREGRARVRHHERGGKPRGARVRRRHLHEGEQGDRRGVDEVVLGPGGVAHAARHAARSGEGQAEDEPGPPAVPRAGRHGRAGRAHPGRVRPVHRGGGARVQGRPQRAVRGPRHGRRHQLRGRAQAQGDQLPARRGLSGRRDEARPHRAHRRGLPRHRRRDEEPGLRQGGVQPAGEQGARRHGGGHRHRGR